MGTYVIKLPDIGEGIAEAELVEWNVKVGDYIKEDDVIASVMTDKATVEIPASASGTVLWLGGEVGEPIAIGSDFVKLDVEGEGNAAAAQEAPAAQPEPAAEPEPEPQPEPAAPVAAAPASGKGTYLIKLPDIGEGIAEAELVEWNVKVGDHVNEDDVLASVMTDKATVEIPASTSGKVIWLGGEVGQPIAIGSDFVKLEVDGAGNAPAQEAPAPAPAPEKKAEAAPQPAVAKPAPQPQAAIATAAPRPSGGKALAAPAVRMRAKTLGIDLASVGGTGPEGRVTHADLDNFLKSGAPKAAGKAGAAPAVPAAPVEPLASSRYKEIKVKGLRRKIAERMSLSKSRIPHITIVEEVDVTDLEALRARLNASKGANGSKLTVLPFIMRAMSRALADYPSLNAHYDDNAEIVRVYDSLHIGIATQTDNGLMVPVVRNCESLGIWQLANDLVEVTSAARSGKAAREVLSGSTITITSLGPLGALATTPIINHPEVSIVGINKMAVRPMWNGETFVPRKMMNISCSFDHRVVDGWDAAVFVKRLKELLENPSVLFVRTTAIKD